MTREPLRLKPFTHRVPLSKSLLLHEAMDLKWKYLFDLKGLLGSFVEINWAPSDRSCSPFDSEKASTPFIVRTLVQVLYGLIFHDDWHTPCSPFTWMHSLLCVERVSSEPEGGLRFQPRGIRCF